MSPLERIQKEIAGARRSVRIEDIHSVINKLEAMGYRVSRVPFDSGGAISFRIRVPVDQDRGQPPPGILNICTHNRGRAQIKPCYVNDFIDCMIELGVYEG